MLNNFKLLVNVFVLIAVFAFFLGGSITWNPGWRQMVGNYLKQQFPSTEFDFINAGIPSLGSTPGVMRITRDVLSKGTVDLLFVEAAVNDDTNEIKPDQQVRGMEGIIYQALRSNPCMDKWSGSLHLPWLIILEDELQSCRHKLILRMAPDKNPASTGCSCRIHEFVVNV